MGRRTSSSRQATEDSPRRQVLRTFTIQAGPTPLGISVSPTNIVTYVDPQHPDAATLWRVGDALIWVDGVEVRGGSCRVPEALQQDKDAHTFVVQRMAPEIPGKIFFSLRIKGNPNLGIRLTNTNHVLHLDEGTPSALDGRLQVRLMLPRPLPPLALQARSCTMQLGLIRPYPALGLILIRDACTHSCTRRKTMRSYSSTDTSLPMAPRSSMTFSTRRAPIMI